MDLMEFFQNVITSKEAGWLPICASLPDGSGWRQYWRGWPDDAESAIELIQGLKDEGLNVFYSAHLFKEKETKKKYVIDTRTMFADLDEAEPLTIPVRPTILVNSSDEKYQCYWLLEDWLQPDDFEVLSKRVTYGIPKADHTGWYIGKMMRVPGTFNFKYVPQQRVRIKWHNKLIRHPEDFNVFEPIELSSPNAILIDDDWIEEALAIPAGFNNITYFWDSVKPKMAKGTELYFYHESPDRSNALWRLMLECFRAGLTREQVYLIAYHSKNNKFRFLRYGANQALAKDVLRAERTAQNGPSSIRDLINTSRKLANIPLNERRQAVAEMCRNQLLTYGRFVHARGGTLWYILEKEGRPVSISRASTQLNVLLEAMFGLNATEPEHQYVVANLINHTAALPETGEISSLSYYLPMTDTLLLHTGNKDVVRITPDTIDTVTNGYQDILFPWNSDQTMTPNVVTTYSDDDTWYDALFGMSLTNLAKDGIDAPQAMALLRAWFLTMLMRNAIASRPILAVFGQPGSGKSTLFKRVYAMIYGPHKSVQGVGTSEQFDYAMSADPFLALDNVDTWERWLPDRIARAAGISEMTRRKLYTDTDLITLRLQAYLGITAHNPKFGREDVLDRFIMITLERIQNFGDETEIVQRIINNRNKYWGQIAADMQRVLREPEPPRETVAQFRVQDFSKVGQRIANALQFGDTFHDAISRMVDQQKGFVLDEDSVLVDIIDKYIKSPKFKSYEFQTPAKLWGIFDILGGMDKSFSRQYSNSVKLGRKLWAMQDALKQRFVVEWEFDAKQKTKVWRFKNRGSIDGQTE